MKDFAGKTVRDYKAEIKGFEKDIVDLNNILNNYYLENIFAPSGIGNSRVYTQKGTLRKNFVKQVKEYRKWIQHYKDMIALRTEWIKYLK